MDSAGVIYYYVTVDKSGGQAREKMLNHDTTCLKPDFVYLNV